jgi:NACalpha-BTF3-like transcription factor
MIKDLTQVDGIEYIHQFNHQEIEIFSFPSVCDERMKRKIFSWSQTMPTPSQTTFRFENSYAMMRISKKHIICVVCGVNSNLGEIRNLLEHLD